MQSDNPIDIMNIKLKRFKKYFKDWGSDNFGKARKRRKWLREELGYLEKLQETDTLSPELYCEKVDMLVELNNLLLEEEIAWLQKSHENWLLKGDSNTEYFHRTVNGTRRRNTILSLNCGDMVIEGNKNLLKYATDFYKELFGPAPGNLCGIDSNMWGEKENLSDIDNFILLRPFSDTEIKNALFSMKHNKAPGPDNIPIEFFQYCWDIVKKDVMLLFEWFYENKLDVERLNYGIITLLPKVVGANKMQQFRPICLLRCVYKLITKVLTIRLEPFVDILFSRHQNAFIKNRDIMDGIMSLHEILHHSYARKKPGIVLKLDFEKA